MKTCITKTSEDDQVSLGTGQNTNVRGANRMETVQTEEHMPRGKGTEATQPLPLAARNLDYTMLLSGG